MICLLQPTKKGDGDTEDSGKPDSPSKPQGDQTMDDGSSSKANTEMGAGEATSEAASTPSKSPTTTATTDNTDDTSHHSTKAKQRASITSLLCAETAANMEDPVAWQTTIADCGKHLDYYETSRLRVGIIIHTTETTHRALRALASPASSCKVTALAVLKPPPSFSMVNLMQLNESAENDHDNNSNNEALGHLTPGSIMRQWMDSNNLGNHSESVAVLGGEEGARQIVQREDVDAVFLIVPDEIHRKYALSALESRKHVLLNDPVSISLEAFKEQLDYARKYGKFVQSSTAFINQYRVRHFMECVIGLKGQQEEDFGNITSMDAHLSVCSQDLHLVGVTPPPAPLKENEGCIRRLGRYCVLYSILLFGKLGSHPVSVQVHSATVQEASSNADTNDNSKPSATQTREPTSAKCTVKYSDDRKLTFDVCYSSASTTRQRLEVKTAACMATMSDFVFPHPDGLATYRVYEDIKKDSDSNDVADMHGEAIDIAGGPTHDVVMWRKFAELSRSVDECGWDDSPLTEQVRELATITLHTKKVLNALMKSFEGGFVEVQL